MQEKQHKRSFLYIINPISGTRGKQKTFDDVHLAHAANGLPYQFIETNAAGDYHAIKEKIIAENISDVIICGGDGTVNQIVNAMGNIDVNFGIVPLGSGNGLALTAGISRNISKALQVVFAGKAKPVDGFMINDSFSCMLCGLGFDALIAKEFSLQKKRGLKTYMRQIFKYFPGAKAYPFSLRIKGVEIKTSAYFISVANSNQFGNHMKIAPKASLSDGLIDIVVVQKMIKPKLMFNLFIQMFFGRVETQLRRKYNPRNILYFQTDKLEIDNPTMAPLHIDGDPAETSEKFVIKILKHRFNLLQP